METFRLPLGGAGSVQPIIQEDTITKFYTSIHTVWHETQFIEGDIESYSVVARRSGSEWYAAVMNAGDRRTITLSLSRLGIDDVAQAVLYHQTSPKHKDVVNVKNLKPSSYGNITFTVNAGTGAVVHIISK